MDLFKLFKNKKPSGGLGFEIGVIGRVVKLI